MDWAERFETIRENYVGARRIQLFMLGGLIAAAGAWPMYSDTMHQIVGKPSTATLIEHIRECTVEYQRVGENKRKDPMACDAAEEVQRLIGSNRIKVSENSFARVRFSLADGNMHEAKVTERTLDSNQLPVGAQIAVVYAPNHPDDVRQVLTWERFKISLMLFAVGLVLVLIAGAGQVAALFAWVLRSRTLDADNAPLMSPAATQMLSAGRGAASRIAGSAPRTTFGTRR
jgi:hypothetical protein